MHLTAVVRQQGARNAHIFNCDAVKAPTKLEGMLRERLVNIKERALDEGEYRGKEPCDSINMKEVARIGKLGDSAAIQQPSSQQGGSEPEAVQKVITLAGWPSVFDRVLVDAPCSGLGELMKEIDGSYIRETVQIGYVKRGYVREGCVTQPRERECVCVCE